MERICEAVRIILISLRIEHSLLINLNVEAVVMFKMGKSLEYPTRQSLPLLLLLQSGQYGYGV